MISTAAARRAYAGPALFSFGFRPFFFLGAIWSALVVPLWLFSYFHGGSAALTREWHIHEMIFGFLGAVIAGFLTTAVPNWTGRMPVIGAPLAGLVSLWVLGRLAMLFQDNLGPAAAVIDSLFLLTFAAVIWREVLAGRNWRNLPVCALITLLALANVAFHLPIGAAVDVGVRLALGAATLLIGLIGGRIVPSFTRNWMKVRSLKPEPSTFGAVDRVALGLTVVSVGLWVAAPETPVTGAALMLAGVAHLVRLARWRGWRAAAEPLVWILHLGYGWLGVSLLFLGGASLDPGLVPRSVGIHALTAGAVGVMTLAVMTRATRGHTGRPLAADTSTMAIYLAINAAALLRVAAPFSGVGQSLLLTASSLAWSLAFGGFAVAYGRMLVLQRPRAA
ncbi:NnrS family protein [Phenylobacterium sp. LH3H17]|uniref:NnrS family protein n=1 Tax=Phenylobacterium sp. LH3H17 TaxID=2903901 RepID=UPI0020C95DCE|nr:NnrS family protein [Phenylobacterium sp. LH3H17]UTP38451.1 NnrS family protein [Phenylobacterium sp. LH3H17]